MVLNRELAERLQAGLVENFNPWNELAVAIRQDTEPFARVHLVNGDMIAGTVLAFSEGWVHIQPPEERPLWLSMNAIATWSLQWES